ncbi:MAG: hypothetical protein IT371_31865 [Deltaproteobacteria bacterium]|nr:hypothetical protein [Deltaproteobacteria bacterium]
MRSPAGLVVLSLLVGCSLIVSPPRLGDGGASPNDGRPTDAGPPRDRASADGAAPGPKAPCRGLTVLGHPAASLRTVNGAPLLRSYVINEEGGDGLPGLGGKTEVREGLAWARLQPASGERLDQTVVDHLFAELDWAQREGLCAELAVLTGTHAPGWAKTLVRPNGIGVVGGSVPPFWHPLLRQAYERLLKDLAGARRSGGAGPTLDEHPALGTVVVTHGMLSEPQPMNRQVYREDSPPPRERLWNAFVADPGVDGAGTSYLDQRHVVDGEHMGFVHADQDALREALRAHARHFVRTPSRLPVTLYEEIVRVESGGKIVGRFERGVVEDGAKGGAYGTFTLGVHAEARRVLGSRGVLGAPELEKPGTLGAAREAFLTVQRLAGPPLWYGSAPPQVLGADWEALGLWAATTQRASALELNSNYRTYPTATLKLLHEALRRNP